MRKLYLTVTLALTLLLFACSPKVGSKEWCEELRDKPKGDWTIDETKNYTKHCFLRK